MPPTPTEDSQRADPLAEHRQRARWRFIGALIFAVLASAVSYSVLLDTPRPLARDFAVLMPAPAAPSASAEAAPPPASAAPSESATAPAPSVPATAPAEERAGQPAAVKPEPVQTFVQVGAYGSRSAADQVKKRLEASGHKVMVSAIGSGSAQRHRVRIGPVSEDDAKGVVAQAKLQGYDAALVREPRP